MDNRRDYTSKVTAIEWYNHLQALLNKDAAQNDQFETYVNMVTHENDKFYQSSCKNDPMSLKRPL